MTAGTTAGRAAPAVASPPEAAREGGPRWRRWAVRTGAVAVAGALWQILTVTDARIWLRFDRLPALDEVAAELAGQLGTSIFYLDLLQSLIRRRCWRRSARSRPSRWCRSRSSSFRPTNRGSCSSRSPPRSSRSW
ncbi:hypothetical protein [Spongiactinospora gelatinilytica]|uniref:hypothetical protein n=1 Tax=Spongiactinospora gelatinilytica TaxID=2666298 RepID=UPI001F1D0EA1|nr:hypothetical protein [Spongiactinospora gelatinilytica]